MGVTAPTVSKAVAHLLRSGLLEEVGIAPRDRAGRPFTVYRLARGSKRVVGVLVGVQHCIVVAAGLDGMIDDTQTVQFDTPRTYAGLIKALARAISRHPRGVGTMGIGISVPGEVDVAQQKVIFSPNLHFLNGHSPSRDLQRQLGIRAVLVHDTAASALAEQLHGAGRDMSDFVRIGIYEGFGVSIVSGGKLLHGARGLAGELGHITVDLEGERCGCGNRGCLETVATDAAFARLVSGRLGRKLQVEEIVARSRSGDLDVRQDLDRTLTWLSVGLAAAINLFNPQAILLTSRMLDADEGAFDRLKEMTAARALKAMADDCQIVRVNENVRQGVIAAIVSHLTDTLGPTMR
jgi:N-acetylglucosamine repressor